MYLDQYGGSLTRLGRLSGPQEIVANLLNIARSQLEVREDAGDDEDSAGRIKAYRQAVTNLDADRDPEPWCADFVSWVHRQAGVPLGPKGSGFASNISMAKWLKSYATWGKPGEWQPAPGDILILALNNPNKPNHTALVESVNGPTDVNTIDGNYSSKVSRARWKDPSQMYLFARMVTDSTTPTAAPSPTVPTTTTPTPTSPETTTPEEDAEPGIDPITAGVVVVSLAVIGFVGYKLYSTL